MCCFTGERKEEDIGTKGIKTERKNVEKDYMKKVISLLKFSRSFPLSYLIAINTYLNSGVMLSGA
jgi:hypothetical protein